MHLSRFNAIALVSLMGLTACGGGGGGAPGATVAPAATVTAVAPTPSAPTPAPSSPTTGPVSPASPAVSTVPTTSPTAGVVPSTPPALEIPLGPPPAGSATVPPSMEALRWSSAATWGGALPGDGARVVIPRGRAVLLDVNTPRLAGLTIDGALYVADQDAGIVSSEIVVNGLLQAGTPERPHAHRLSITLTGTEETRNPGGMGTKMVGVASGGRLELHGHRRDAVAWTKLAQDAQPGDTRVTLTDPVDWRPGDRVALAPSGFDASEAEAVTITGIAGATVSFTPALRHRHRGTLEFHAGRRIDQRSAVGLLTRDILIQGDAASAASQFGGHVMVMPGGFARVAGVEFYRMGQMGHMGRYPLHWHWVDRFPERGVTGQGQYALGNSFHGSFHRAIVVHGTSGIRAEHNVAHDIHGHIFVPAEDGDEENTVWRWNLGVWAKKPLPGQNAFPVVITTGPATGTTLQTEGKPSVFWSRNMNHTLIGNIAAGSEGGNGFFFDGFVQHDPEEPNPATLPLRVQRPARFVRFESNVAHSHCGRHAETNQLAFEGPVYSGAATMHGLLVHRAVFGPSNDDLVFDNLVAFKNCRSGAWMETGREVLRNATLTDNNWALIPEHEPRVTGLLAMGATRNDIGGVARERGGIVFNDKIGARFDLRDSTFVGLANGVMTWVDDFEVAGGRSSGLTIVDSVRLGASGDLRGASTGGFADLDGSLLGTQGPSRLSINPLSASSVGVDARVFGSGSVERSIRVYVTPGP